MRIRSVVARWLHVPIPVEQQHTSDFGRSTSFDSVLVRVETECGIVGYGEAKEEVGSHGNCHALVALINQRLAPLLEGQDPREINRLWEVMYNGPRAHYSLARGHTFPALGRRGVLVSALGGIDMARMIHRWAATALVLGSIYHLLTSSYRLFVKHEDMRMLPDLKDGFDLRDTVAYNLGIIDEPPKMRKFNFGEKFEYWAVVWGTGVMIATGFILWNPIAATRFMPGSYIPVAVLAHGWEAVLAAVSIVIWHLYNVLAKHRNVSMFTGTLSHKIMEEEHALELERLQAGGEPWKVIPAAVLARRRKIFMAVAGVVLILAVVLVFWMFTFEDTAIIAPQVTRDVFVPLATPIP